MGRFNFHTTAEEAAAALSGSIKDKIILITGANMGGIGFETARAIALQHPARLILAGRSQSKLDDAEHAIHAEAPDVRTQQLILDLSSLASVRSAAQQIHDCTDLPRIDVLINNGGVMALPFTLTTDGYEAHFATNHLSHFLLTGLLRDKLLAAGPGARVVNVTSDSHQMGGVRFDDLTFEKGGDYHPMMAYAQSKTANMLHAVALTRRLAPSGGVAYSVHPGVIPTNLGRYVGFEGMVKMGLIDEQGKTIDTEERTWKTLGQGASTTVVAAFDPSISDRNGAFLCDSNVTEPLAAHAKDPELAERLWALSEKLVGEKFDF